MTADMSKRMAAVAPRCDDQCWRRIARKPTRSLEGCSKTSQHLPQRYARNSKVAAHVGDLRLFRAFGHEHFVCHYRSAFGSRMCDKPRVGTGKEWSSIRGFVATDHVLGDFR
jgi:hypothetical protein